MILTCGVYSVTLPEPQIGNTQSTINPLSRRETRIGEASIAGLPDRVSESVYVLSFVCLTKPELERLSWFMDKAQALEVYAEFTGLAIHCYVFNEDLEASTKKDACSYEVTLRLRESTIWN
jgi:hypothetical protein